MQDFDKRIEKLKTDEKRITEKIKEYNEKISEIQKKIVELENQKIVTTFRSTGFSLEDVITHISALSKENDDFEKEFAALEAAEKEEENEI